MNQKSLLLPALAATVLATLTTIPSAFAVKYTIAGGTVSGNNVDPGLVVSTLVSSDLAGTVFSLNSGESKKIDFFNIWTTETTINPDDKQKSNITATLNLSDPFWGGSFGGVTFGGSTWYGAQSGTLTWNTGPVTVTLGALQYSIVLNDVTFNAGLFGGLTEGSKYGATVTATIKQISSTAVPDSGGTAMLLGLAFLTIAFARRRSVIA